VSRNSIQINHLEQRHLNAIELMLRGCSDQQIGAHLRVDRGTIFRWRNAPLFAAELKRQRELLREQTHERLKSMFEPALDTVHRLLAADDAKVALRAAQLLLQMSAPQPRMLEAPRPAATQIHALLSAIRAYVNHSGATDETMPSGNPPPKLLPAALEQ
jgi:hypothetical protein